MSRDDWWDALYREDTNPGQDTDRDNKTQDTTPPTTRHQVPDKTRQDETHHAAATGPGRIITLHRPLQGPREIKDLLTKKATTQDTAESEKQNRDTLDAKKDTTNEEPQDHTPDARQDTETDDTHDSETEELTAKEALKELYQRVGKAFERANDETTDDTENTPKHSRPRYEPPNEARSPRAALADLIGAMPTRYRWPLYHLGAAAAGEALALTPWIDTGLVSYARDGASIVAELGWSDTWNWWGTVIAAAVLYAWSRYKHWAIAWPCTIPLASAVIGALLYTPNL